MFKKIFQSIKDAARPKDMLIWFVLSFIGVFVFFVLMAHKTVDTNMLIETFGFAVVFVLMMIGTKAYGVFVSGYYQRLIDRENRKKRPKQTKKGKKKG